MLDVKKNTCHVSDVRLHTDSPIPCLSAARFSNDRYVFCPSEYSMTCTISFGIRDKRRGIGRGSNAGSNDVRLGPSMNIQVVASET